MWNEIIIYWNSFIKGYCKVDFLCYGGSPNWLGWIPIGIIGFFVLVVVLAIFLGILEQDATERELNHLNINS